jgi:Domain of unknown function (DUF4440)
VTRRIVLLPLLAVALVGFVKGTTEKKVELVRYPLPGSEDTVGEVETKQARKVLDDFYQSKVLDEGIQIAMSNDAAARGRLIADQAVRVSERFGIGERLTKAQVLANIGSGGEHNDKVMHDHIRLVAFGNNVVVVSGRSTSTLQYGGKVFNGPRVFGDVWVKEGGRWQQVLHSVADAPNGVTRGFE